MFTTLLTLKFAIFYSVISVSHLFSELFPTRSIIGNEMFRGSKVMELSVSSMSFNNYLRTYVYWPRYQGLAMKKHRMEQVLSSHRVNSLSVKMEMERGPADV